MVPVVALYAVMCMRPVDQTVPTPRVSFGPVSRHFVPGYLHAVPRDRVPRPVYKDSAPTEHV